MSIPVKNDWMKNAKVGIKGGGGKTQTVIQFKITNFSLSTLLVVVLLNKYLINAAQMSEHCYECYCICECLCAASTDAKSNKQISEAK